MTKSTGGKNKSGDIKDKAVRAAFLATAVLAAIGGYKMHGGDTPATPAASSTSSVTYDLGGPAGMTVVVKESVPPGDPDADVITAQNGTASAGVLLQLNAPPAKGTPGIIGKEFKSNGGTGIKFNLASVRGGTCTAVAGSKGGKPAVSLTCSA